MDDRPRDGDNRIPPGQYVSQKWPVLTYGATPKVQAEDVELKIFGIGCGVRSLSWTDLQALPRVEVVADFHCVTRFSTLDNEWSGWSTRSLFEGLPLHPEARHVLVHCYGGYTTNLPLEDLLSERALVADRHNGRPLEDEHGGPLRLVVPHLYAWKSAKWVKAFELLEAEDRGFWESSGYHTYGDPWQEQRFSSQETRNAAEVRRRAKDLGLKLADG